MLGKVDKRHRKGCTKGGLKEKLKHRGMVEENHVPGGRMGKSKILAKDCKL